LHPNNTIVDALTWKYDLSRLSHWAEFVFSGDRPLVKFQLWMTMDTTMLFDKQHLTIAAMLHFHFHQA
jgi:hypothetical protein